MADLDPAREAALFAQITQGFGSEPITISASELLTVPFDGTPVGLNAMEGAGLRTDLTDAYAMAMADIRADDTLAMDDLMAAGKLVADELEKVLLQQRYGFDLGKVFAVRGSGMYIISDEDTGAQKGVILGGSTLFGRLRGVAYGPYLRVEAPDSDSDTGAGLPVTQHLGALIVMSQVFVCRTDETYGPIDRSYDEALVPIHLDALNFYGVYADR